MAKTFAQRLSDARLMAAGIRSHAEELKSVSIGEERAVEIDTLLAKLQELDTRQEKLKAELKNCTSELTEQDKQLNDIMQDSKKRVKITIHQSLWQEFGIGDKK